MTEREDSWALLVSIRPEFAAKIFQGTKRVELRRVRPRVEEGHGVLVYVSSPTKELQGAFEVRDVVEAPPKRLWREVGSHAGITREEFEAYFEGADTGYAIRIKRAWEFDRPQTLTSLRRRMPKFAPPQSYHYLDKAKAAVLLGKAKLANA
ncbi:MAG: ASCH domain-containing protein [Planctomycetota bacterium]|nr:ASCH domain-containing protein [Planctomycetota bacterium]